MSAEAVWPAEGLEHLGRCPVCDATARAVLHADLTDRVFRSAPGRWTMYRCAACGSAYLDPRPDESTIHLAYLDYHTHEAPERERPRSRLARVGRALLHDYLNARFGYAFVPSLGLGRRLVPLVPGAAALAGLQVRELPHPTGRACLLDVGCGNGEFLVRMRNAGWEVEGLDPDPAAVRRARDAGLDVELGTLSTVPQRIERYDAITLSHVIEHVHDPHGTVRACFSALRPGGVIWIDTPNVAARGHGRFGRDWFPLEPPRHLVLFTPTSLRALLGAAGFLPVADPPAPLSSLLWADRMSAAVRVGARPFESPPRLRPMGALRAVLDDLHTLRHPDRGVELVVLGRRPDSRE